VIYDKSDINGRRINCDSSMDGNECDHDDESIHDRSDKSDDDEEDDDHDVVSDDKMIIIMWLVMIR
jgi:hypothetical protein